MSESQDALNAKIDEILLNTAHHLYVHETTKSWVSEQREKIFALIEQDKEDSDFYWEIYLENRWRPCSYASTMMGVCDEDGETETHRKHYYNEPHLRPPRKG